MGTTECPPDFQGGGDNLLAAWFSDLNNGIMAISSDEESIKSFQVLINHLDDSNSRILFNTMLESAIDGNIIDLRLWQHELLNNSVSIFPNPTNGELIISDQSSYSDQSHLVLIDMSGHKIVVTPDLISNNKYTLRLNEYNLSAGFYILKIVRTDGTSIIKRFIYQPQ